MTNPFIIGHKKTRGHAQRGFTAVETIMTIFIFSIIMLGVSLLLKDILATVRQQTLVIDNTDQARRIASSFVKEIRNATSGANGAYAINEASDNQLIFFSPATNNNGTISKIRYYMVNNTLNKGVTQPAGNPLSYNGQQEVVTALLTKMSLGGNPLFYYYDGNYSGNGNSLAQPVNINQIKYIKINLTVLKELTATSNTTFTVSAGASIRNLKNNLGN